MKSQTVDKAAWVQIFKATGQDEKSMKKWHQEFERLLPEGHQEFLEWLGIPAEEIATIRRDRDDGSRKA